MGKRRANKTRRSSKVTRRCRRCGGPGLFSNQKVKFVEIHLTNQCNLNCAWCSYKNVDRSTHLKFDDLEKTASLLPDEVLIAGGGEPTLYEDDGRTFNDAVLKLAELLPKTKLRLITNGTIIPSGEWINTIDEISISLDEPRRSCYRGSKGKDLFNSIWQNMLWYLKESPIPSVRVTAIYDKTRVGRSLQLARKLSKAFDSLVKRNRLSSTKAENFRFMMFPMACDESPDAPYASTELTSGEKDKWRKKIERIKADDPRFWKFISEHTNVALQPLKDLGIPSVGCCWPLADYILVGADRKYYPCFAASSSFRDHNLGSVCQDPKKLLAKRKRKFHDIPRRCRQGCRPSSTFYGLRVFDGAVKQFNHRVLAEWDKRADNKRGILWNPERMKYKILSDGHDPEHAPSPSKTDHLCSQYNESRCIPFRRKRNGRAKRRANSVKDNCPFCNVSRQNILADLERYWGLPYVLTGDSRPFFDKHMLALAKEHSGGRITFPGFRDLVWIVNVLFPGMRGNIGTGNLESHLHVHIYKTEFPIERWPRNWFVKTPECKVGTLKNKLGLAYFVVESENVELLARRSYVMMKELERRGLLTCIILAPNSIFIVPQSKKTIGKDYPRQFDALKDEDYRPAGVRPRYIGPAEAAGIFLCYSRAATRKENIETMLSMYVALTSDIYERILRDTGLSVSSPLYREVVELFKVLYDGSDQLLSFFDPMAAETALCGGKGKNLHYLRELSESNKEPDRIKAQHQDPNSMLNIPDGYVLTTRVLDELLAGQKSIRESISRLKKLSLRLSGSKGDVKKRIEAGIAKQAEKIRRGIIRLNFPDSLVKKLTPLLQILGGNVAVRSSATMEDDKRSSAAGRAVSFLHQKKIKDVLSSIKEVWASLFDAGFVFYRIGQGLTSMVPQMAVILQEMVDSVSISGVVDTIDSLHRPAFKIVGGSGVGAVVDGESADAWLVSPDAKYILEKSPRNPKDPMEASLHDQQVLQVASIVGSIRDFYRTKRSVEHVNVEFAVDGDGVIHITQTRPITTIATRDRFEVRTVEVDNIPHARRQVKFDGAETASAGVATGKLKIVDIPGDANSEEAERMISEIAGGDILVTARTNCRWNVAFHRIAGVITEEGTANSHAAIHSRETGIPCVVRASDAIIRLRQFDGEVVTMDSTLRTIFSGEIPIVTETRNLSLWRDCCELQACPDGSEIETETLADWRKHRNFMEDSDGEWFARPLIPYSLFQLDYYAKAFRYYENMLRHLKWPSGKYGKPSVPEQALKIKDSILYVELSRTSIQMIKFMESLCLEDVEYLMDLRWQCFRDFSSYLQKQVKLSKANVGKIVNGLIKALAVNSLGYEFRQGFASRYVEPQKRYVQEEYWPLMLQVSLPKELRNHIQGELQKELEATAELIRQENCESVLSAGDDMNGSGKSHQDVCSRIDRLSREYKLYSEDIRIISEKAKCLEILAELIAPGNSGITLGQLANYCMEYLGDSSKSNSAVRNEIRKKDENLYLVIRAYVRKKMGLNTKRGITTHLSEAMDKIRGHVNSRTKKLKEVERALDAYPTLKRVLSVTAQEQIFRNDAHHLIARIQRKVAELMLDIARKYPELFARPEQIFDLGIDGLINLIQDERSPMTS